VCAALIELAFKVRQLGDRLFVLLVSMLFEILAEVPESASQMLSLPIPTARCASKNHVDEPHELSVHVVSLRAFVQQAPDAIRDEGHARTGDGRRMRGALRIL
jgi:hypothetical protein